MINHHRLTEEPETLDEAYEQQRINALPEPLQHLAAAHRLDQFTAAPSLVQQNATDFITFCDALEIRSVKE
ncbi:MAG TPA: hypothetical protein VGN34_17605 [Ktedonobacteraceae bacterium]